MDPHGDGPDVKCDLVRVTDYQRSPNVYPNTALSSSVAIFNHFDHMHFE